MRFIREIPALQNIPVLVRSSLNVPIAGGAVASDYRLRRAIPTIKALSAAGARVILIGHIGRAGTETLLPVYHKLKTFLPEVSFFHEAVGPRVREVINTMPAGGVLVLENLRRYKGETANDPEFAHELSLLADIFVEDAFDVCHRAHASVVRLPKLLPAYAGLMLEEEARELSLARAPENPALAIVGGAKFETKETLIESLVTTYDAVFVGGALAIDFFRASGNEVGKSLASPVISSAVERLLAHPRLLLPIDVMVVSESEIEQHDARARARAVNISQILPDEVMLDHGPDTRTMLANMVARSKAVLWNGPLGNYERGFVDTTEALARSIAASRVRSVVGGGDTVAAIDNLNLLDKFSFVSTGGGAMLDYLIKGTLPGIEALG